MISLTRLCNRHEKKGAVRWAAPFSRFQSIFFSCSDQSHRTGRVNCFADPMPRAKNLEGRPTVAQSTIVFRTKPVVVIISVTIAEDATMALAEYLRVTGLLLKRVGAIMTKRFQISEMMVGTPKTQFVVMLEYPCRAAVDLVFNSPEYKIIIPIRDKAFLTYKVSIVTD